MRSFPWDSLIIGKNEEYNYPIIDRPSSAEDLRELYKTFFTNGVFLNEEDAFQVTPGDGMNVIVAGGKCGIEGTIGYEAAPRGLAIQASSSTADRIDTVVLRWNNNIEVRSIDMYVKTGVAQDVPVRPNLTRSESVWELGIADIFVAKNSGAISSARITDTRLQTDRCGAVTPFATIDTTSFFNQIQAAIDENVATLQEQTQVAVDLAKDAIDGTTAGNLQNQITDNNKFVESYLRDEYDGRNLLEAFADEIEESGSWITWIKGRIANRNYDGMMVRDYIPITLSNGIEMPYAIGRFDGTFGAGDPEETNGSIDFVPIFAYPGNVRFNTTNTNQGTESNQYPYLVSTLHQWELNTYLAMLPSDLQSAIVSRNGLLEKRYNAGQTLSSSNGWGFADLGKIWSLSEMEVYGCPIRGTTSWSVGFDTQFPIFAQARDRIRRSASDGATRRYWWLRVVSGSTSTSVCYVGEYGEPNAYSASGDGFGQVPCFRL